MNSIIESLTGMNKLTDEVIVTDFLVSSKSTVLSYSIALTEVTSPEIRIVLKNQLNDAITTHEAISNYMIKKGYYKPDDLNEQYIIDMKTSDTALNLADKIM